MTVVEKVAMRKGQKQGMEKGMKKGVRQGHLDVGRRMLDQGVPIDKIMEYTGLAASDIESMGGDTVNKPLG